MNGAPRLVVLGGGRHQIDLVERAESRGIEVVLVDYLPDAPARRVATHSLILDTLDVPGVVAAARAHGADGITTTGTDLPVTTMSEVAEELHLPCYISPEAARLATDKLRMHGALTAAGVRRPWQLFLDGDISPTDIPSYPAITKPADSQGQRGVVLARSPDDLGDALATSRAFSRSARVVIEQYVEGPEITANAWVEGDHVALLAVNDRVTFNPPPHVGIAYRHVHPTRQPVDLEDVADQLRRIAAAYGMRAGPLYVQMIAAPGGVVTLEAAARVGGGHESTMFPLVCGGGSEDRLIDLALSGSCEPWGYDMRATEELPHASVTFVLGRQGIVRGKPSVELEPETLRLDWYVGVGARLSEVENSLGRIGFFLSTATDAASLDRGVNRQYARLSVPGEDGSNLVLEPDAAFLNS